MGIQQLSDQPLVHNTAEFLSITFQLFYDYILSILRENFSFFFFLLQILWKKTFYRL